MYVAGSCVIALRHSQRISPLSREAIKHGTDGYPHAIFICSCSNGLLGVMGLNVPMVHVTTSKQDGTLCIVKIGPSFALTGCSL